MSSHTAAQLQANSAARAQLWADVHHAELDYSKDRGSSYACKCGHLYVVEEELLDRLLDDDDEYDEVRLVCERCSLGIRIVAGMQ